LESMRGKGGNTGEGLSNQEGWRTGERGQKESDRKGVKRNSVPVFEKKRTNWGPFGKKEPFWKRGGEVLVRWELPLLEEGNGVSLPKKEKKK